MYKKVMLGLPILHQKYPKKGSDGVNRSTHTRAQDFLLIILKVFFQMNRNIN